MMTWLDDLTTVVPMPIWLPLAVLLVGQLFGTLSLWLASLILHGVANRTRSESVSDRSKVTTAAKTLPAEVSASVVKTKVPVARADVSPGAELAPEPAPETAPEPVPESAPVVRKKNAVTVGSIVISKVRKEAPSAPVMDNPSPAVSETLSIGEAAKRAGLARTSIYRWIQIGKIQATRVDDEWRIDAKSLDAVLEGK